MSSAVSPIISPVRLGLITDADVVRHGVRALLLPYVDRVVLIDMHVLPSAEAVDVALLDVWSPWA